MVERTQRLTALLDDAMLIAESAREETVLQHLQGARRVLYEVERGAAPTRIDVLSGRVFADGVPVALSRAELALVMSLALNERGLARDVLAEDLCGHADDTSLSTIKVHVHRVRRRIGSHDVIRCVAGRYVLGDAVDVELPRLEADVRRLRIEDSLTAEQRDRFERARQRIFDGRPAFMLEWSWFDETESRLRELGHDLTAMLAWDALRNEHYVRALDLAAEIAHLDPLDELAAEIAIRSCIFAGNRTAAIFEFRRFKQRLQREDGSAPSAGLAALVDDAAQTNRHRSHDSVAGIPGG